MASEQPTGTIERDEFDVDVIAGQRRGAHRAAATPLMAVLPWILGVIFLVAVVVTFVTMSGLAGGGASTPTATPTPTPTATPTPTPTAAPEVDKGVALLVLTGTRSSSVDNRVADKLVENGWIVKDTGSNDDRGLAQTLIVYKDEALAPTAQALAGELGVTPAFALDPNLDEDVRIVIGADYK